MKGTTMAFLALGATATTDLAAAECALTLPQGHCTIPSLAGQCCTLLQAGMDHNKEEGMRAIQGMGKGNARLCMHNIKGDMALLQKNPEEYCTKGGDAEEFPDFLALGATATADLAAAECEVTLPQGKHSCSNPSVAGQCCTLPSVAGQCCTLVQAAVDHNKGAMVRAFKGMKGQGKARLNLCKHNIKADMALLQNDPAAYCTKGEDAEEFPDFLALEDSATEALIEVQDDATEDGATEDGSQIVTGLLGFVAGAAVAGLGATVLRRRTPSQDEYNQIVA